ncbi:uncharacterized protein [Centruroides vittatus]|uniref:uncharacterized protein n=1 Tax=Centruroides vittatus TaxID=120091 RepID=UPI00351048B8
MILAIFCLIFIISVSGESKIPFDKYCVHKNPEATRTCVIDNKMQAIMDVGTECAKKINPDKDLSIPSSRKAYYCDEANKKDREEFVKCLDDGAENLDNTEELLKIISRCIDEN